MQNLCSAYRFSVIYNTSLLLMSAKMSLSILVLEGTTGFPRILADLSANKFGNLAGIYLRLRIATRWNLPAHD